MEMHFAAAFVRLQLYCGISSVPRSGRLAVEVAFLCGLLLNIECGLTSCESFLSYRSRAASRLLRSAGRKFKLQPYFWTSGGELRCVVLQPRAS